MPSNAGSPPPSDRRRLGQRTQDGRDGRDGKDGIDGKPGRDGLPGKDGRSAYQLAVARGFRGSLEQWLASLTGKQGESIRGPKGDTGEIGPMPRHRWIEGTKLQFEQAPGNQWGDPVDLKGPPGERGVSGFGGGTAAASSSTATGNGYFPQGWG